MSEQEETQIPLKILVDKYRNKVLFAEADSDFVNILFSFMTLPMGTIVRLIKKNSDSTPIGCFNSLYECIANLPSHYFFFEECKQMLLHPKNSSEATCSKLKLNVYDAKPTKYFVCGNFQCFLHPTHYSTCDTVKCSCGRLFNKLIRNYQPSEGAFVTESATFMITDDLHVMPNWPGSSIRMLSDLGIQDMRLLEERIVNIGLQEVLKMLELALISKSPLTDLLLCKPQNVQHPIKVELGNLTRPPRAEKSPTQKMNVRIFVQKSIGRALFLQAEENFVDFIFSFLTIPLGSIAGLLSGNTSAGSIDELYNSISVLNIGRYMISQDCKDMLLHPQLDPNYISKKHFFPLKVKMASLRYDIFVECVDLTFKAPDSNEGYVRGPRMFMVTDDLVVTPLSSITTISFLDKLKVPLSDVEEHEVGISIDEGLGLLKASLTSSSALGSCINLLLKKTKHAQ